ncbi:MAG: glycerol-3-phosphate acyltransferase, partial [Candidatus Latescibacteria bacterium]|nr:glycerol-3-phosphate acyltransferase [Candidatus Latescibacterota bacterium]
AAGVFVFAIDLAKGMVAVLVLTRLSSSSFPINLELLRILAAVAVISGHIWTVFAGFKGGKGVGTAAGALLALAPVEVAIAFGVWAVVTFCSGYVSLGSLSAAVTLPLCLGIGKLALNRSVSSEFLVFACLLAGLIILTHRTNIRRLLRGEENRFGSRNSQGNQ